jgi:hypothetical protein
MKNFAIALGLLASVNSFAGVIYSNTADVSTSATDFKIWKAKLFNLATKTEIRDIPNCIPYGEAGGPCTEEVATERTLVLAVDVSFQDGFSGGEGQEKSFVSFVLPAADAGKKLELSVKRAERTIQVVDVRNSKFCPINGETGEAAPGCVENIAYKSAKTWVKEVSVSAK